VDVKTFGFIIQINHEVSSLDTNVSIKSSSVLSACTKMMKKIAQHLDKGDTIRLDYEIASEGEFIDINKLDHPIRDFYLTGTYAGRDFITKNKTGTKKVLLGINTLDIHQGEIMDESYEEDITIHISQAELEKLEKYFGNIIRLTVKE
jgi:hypothetical protein